MEKSWKERNKELASFWRTHIDQWSQAGITQKEYCRRHDLIPHRFTYWKKKFTREHLCVEFVQVPNAGSGVEPCLKLNIGSGLQLEIPDSFSRKSLEKVLAALRILQ